MMRSMQTFFKVKPNSKTVVFGKRKESVFNYVDFDGDMNRDLGNSAQLIKQMNDSYMIEINSNLPVIHELKLTNQNILTWDDLWIDKSTKALIDPKILSINLQKNNLVYANFNTSKRELKILNLEGNVGLSAIFIHEAPKLEVLNLSNCPALEVINLGKNRSIKALLARNCNLSSAIQEKLLRDFTPTVTSSSNRSPNMFRKQYDCLVDVRGMEVDWSNRRVASKIRLLLCNNWMVLWDNAPPVSIIPPQMYAFFTTSLESSLIKDYYSS